jgi:hypothetical protein
MVLGIRSYQSEISKVRRSLFSANRYECPKAEDCTQPRVDAFNRLRGHSTRKGVERSDCSKMTAWILLPAPRVKGQNLLAANGVCYFSGIRRGRKLISSAAVSTNPNCCDTSVMLSQLETSRPRGSERAAFIAFGNFRSFTRYGCLVLGELDNFTAPVAGYRLHLFRKKISNVKVDHFRHNIIQSTLT